MFYYILKFVEKKDTGDIFTLEIHEQGKIKKTIKAIAWNFYEPSSRMMIAIWPSEDKERKISYLIPVANTTIEMVTK